MRMGSVYDDGFDKKSDASDGRLGFAKLVVHAKIFISSFCINVQYAPENLNMFSRKKSAYYRRENTVHTHSGILHWCF